MKLRIFVPTVGEPCTLETISRAKMFTPVPFTMTVWYDTLWHGSDSFYKELKQLCPDVIHLTQPHGIAEAANFAMMALDYDYLLYLPADCFLEKDYWIKMFTPFELYDKVACVGGWRSPMAEPLIWARMNNPEGFSPDDAYPEGPMLFSKAAINEIGFLSPSFHGYGQFFYEWNRRCLKKGWKGAVVDKVMTEQGTGHAGRDLNPRVSEEVEQSQGVLDRIGDAWWRSDW